MFLAVHNGELALLRDLVAGEQRAFGWGFLSGDEGAASKAAFAPFANAVEAPRAA